MKDKKAAKKLIKLAKKHPDWYSKKDVYYAKMIKKRIKEEEKEHKEAWLTHHLILLEYFL